MSFELLQKRFVRLWWFVQCLWIGRLCGSNVIHVGPKSMPGLVKFYILSRNSKLNSNKQKQSTQNAFKRTKERLSNEKLSRGYIVSHHHPVPPICFKFLSQSASQTTDVTDFSDIESCFRKRIPLSRVLRAKCQRNSFWGADLSLARPISKLVCCFVFEKRREHNEKFSGGKFVAFIIAHPTASPPTR